MIDPYSRYLVGSPLQQKLLNTFVSNANKRNYIERYGLEKEVNLAGYYKAPISLVDGDSGTLADGSDKEIRISDYGWYDTADKLGPVLASPHKYSFQPEYIARMVGKPIDHLTENDFKNVSNYQGEEVQKLLSVPNYKVQPFNPHKAYKGPDPLKPVNAFIKETETDKYGRTLVEVINPLTMKPLSFDLTKDPDINASFDLFKFVDTPTNRALQRLDALEKTKFFSQNWVKNTIIELGEKGLDNDGSIGETLDLMESSLIQSGARFVSILPNALIDESYWSRITNGSTGKDVADAIAGVRKSTRRELQFQQQMAIKSIEEGDYIAALSYAAKSIEAIIGDSFPSLLLGSAAAIIGGPIGAGLIALSALDITLADNEQFKINNNDKNMDAAQFTLGFMGNLALLLPEMIISKMLMMPLTQLTKTSLKAAAYGIVHNIPEAAAKKVGLSLLKNWSKAVGYEMTQEFFQNNWEDYISQNQDPNVKKGYFEMITSPENQFAALAAGVMSGSIGAGTHIASAPVALYRQGKINQALKDKLKHDSTHTINGYIADKVINNKYAKWFESLDVNTIINDSTKLSDTIKQFENIKNDRQASKLSWDTADRLETLFIRKQAAKGNLTEKKILEYCALTGKTEEQLFLDTVYYSGLNNSETELLGKDPLTVPERLAEKKELEKVAETFGHSDPKNAVEKAYADVVTDKTEGPEGFNTQINRLIDLQTRLDSNSALSDEDKKGINSDITRTIAELSKTLQLKYELLASVEKGLVDINNGTSNKKTFYYGQDIEGKSIEFKLDKHTFVSADDSTWIKNGLGNIIESIQRSINDAKAKIEKTSLKDNPNLSTHFSNIEAIYNSITNLRQSIAKKVHNEAETARLRRFGSNNINFLPKITAALNKIDVNPNDINSINFLLSFKASDLEQFANTLDKVRTPEIQKRRYYYKKELQKYIKKAKALEDFETNAVEEAKKLKDFYTDEVISQIITSDQLAAAHNRLTKAIDSLRNLNQKELQKDLQKLNQKILDIKRQAIDENIAKQAHYIANWLRSNYSEEEAKNRLIEYLVSLGIDIGQNKRFFKKDFSKLSIDDILKVLDDRASNFSNNNPNNPNDVDSQIHGKKEDKKKKSGTPTPIKEEINLDQIGELSEDYASDSKILLDLLKTVDPKYLETKGFKNKLNAFTPEEYTEVAKHIFDLIKNKTQAFFNLQNDIDLKPYITAVVSLENEYFRNILINEFREQFKAFALKYKNINVSSDTEAEIREAYTRLNTFKNEILPLFNNESFNKIVSKIDEVFQHKFQAYRASVARSKISINANDLVSGRNFFSTASDTYKTWESMDVDARSHELFIIMSTRTAREGTSWEAYLEEMNYFVQELGEHLFTSINKQYDMEDFSKAYWDEIDETYYEAEVFTNLAINARELTLINQARSRLNASMAAARQKDATPVQKVFDLVKKFPPTIFSNVRRITNTAHVIARKKRNNEVISETTDLKSDVYRYIYDCLTPINQNKQSRYNKEDLNSFKFSIHEEKDAEKFDAFKRRFTTDLKKNFNILNAASLSRVLNFDGNEHVESIRNFRKFLFGERGSLGVTNSGYWNSAPWLFILYDIQEAKSSTPENQRIELVPNTYAFGAMELAVDEFLSSSRIDGFVAKNITDDNLLALFGKDDALTVSSSELSIYRDIVRDYGIPESHLAGILGRSVIRHMGLKINDKGYYPAGMYEKIIAGLGQECIQALTKRGFFKQAVFDKQAYIDKKLDTIRNNEEQEEFKKLVNDNIKSSRIRVLQAPDLKDLRNSDLKEIRDEIKKQFNGKRGKDSYQLEERGLKHILGIADTMDHMPWFGIMPDEAYTSVRRTLMHTSRGMAPSGSIFAMAKLQTTGFKLNVTEVDRALIEHLEETKRYLGWKSKEEIALLSRDEKDSAEGRNLEIERTIEELRILTEMQRENPDGRFYYKGYISKNGRLYIDSNWINPQTHKKLARFFIMPEGVTQEISFTNSAEDQVMLDRNEAFALATAFKIKSNSATKERFRKALNKLSTADLKELRDDIYADPNNFGKKWQFKIKSDNQNDIFKLKLENLALAMIAIEHLINKKEAEENHLPSYTTSLPTEIDSTASGFAIRQGYQPLAGILNKAGKSLGFIMNSNENKPMNELKNDSQFYDLYESTAILAHTEYKKIETLSQKLYDAKTKLSNANKELNSQKKVSMTAEAVKEIADLRSKIFVEKSKKDKKQVNRLNSTVLYESFKNISGALPQFETDSQGNIIVSSELRDLMKPPTMVFGYNAGEQSTTQNICNVIMKDVINTYMEHYLGVAAKVKNLADSKDRNDKAIEAYAKEEGLDSATVTKLKSVWKFLAPFETLNNNVNTPLRRITSVHEDFDYETNAQLPIELQQPIPDPAEDTLYNLLKKNYIKDIKIEVMQENTDTAKKSDNYRTISLEKYFNIIIGETYGKAIWNALDGAFKEFTPYSKSINYAFSLMAFLEGKIQKLLNFKEDEVNNEAKNGNGFGVYQAVKNRSMRWMTTLFGPNVPLPWNLNTSNNGIFLEREKKVINYANTVTNFDLNGVAYSTYAETQEITLTDNAGAVIPIHYTDGMIMALMMQTFDNILPIHDAVVCSFTQTHNIADAYNGAIYHLTKEYNVYEAIVNRLRTVCNNYEAYINSDEAKKLIEEYNSKQKRREDMVLPLDKYAMMDSFRSKEIPVTIINSDLKQKIAKRAQISIGDIDRVFKNRSEMDVRDLDKTDREIYSKILSVLPELYNSNLSITTNPFGSVDLLTATEDTKDAFSKYLEKGSIQDYVNGKVWNYQTNSQSVSLFAISPFDILMQQLFEARALFATQDVYLNNMDSPIPSRLLSNETFDDWLVSIITKYNPLFTADRNSLNTSEQAVQDNLKDSVQQFSNLKDKFKNSYYSSPRGFLTNAQITDVLSRGFQDIDAVLTVFDSLQAMSEINGIPKTTSAFLRTLKDLISQLDFSTLANIAVEVSREGIYNEGRFKDGVITINMENKAKSRRFDSILKRSLYSRMTPAEIYAHELIHATTTFAIEHAEELGLQPKVNELLSLYYEASKIVEVEDFIPDSYDSANEVEVKRDALQTYEYIMQNKEHGLAEFISYGLTYPKLRAKLNKASRLNPDKAKLTILEKVVKVLKELFGILTTGELGDRLYSLVSFIKGDISLKTKRTLLADLERLAVELSGAHYKATEELKKHPFHIVSSFFSILYKGIDIGNKFIISNVSKIGNYYENHGLYYEMNRNINESWLGGVAQLLKDISRMSFSSRARKQVINYWASTLNISQQNGILAAIKDILPSDVDTQNFAKLLSQVKMVEAISKKLEVSVLNDLIAEFPRPLTVEETDSLTRVALRVDLQTLLDDDGSNIDYIVDLLKHDKVLETEIQNYEATLISLVGDTNIKQLNWYFNQSKALARFLNERKGMEVLDLNAYSIATMIHSGNPITNVDHKIVQTIDKLVTLYALQKSNKRSKQILSKIGNKGLTNYLRVHKELVKRGVAGVRFVDINKQDVCFATDNKYTYVKGYVKYISSPSYEFTYNFIDQEAAMKDLGWKLVSKIDSNNITHTQPVGIYRRGFPIRSNRDGTGIVTSLSRNIGTTLQTTAYQLARYTFKDTDQISSDDVKMTADNYLDAFNKNASVAANLLADKFLNQRFSYEELDNIITSGYTPTLSNKGYLLDWAMPVSYETAETIFGANMDGLSLLSKMYASQKREVEANARNDIICRFLLHDMKENMTILESTGENPVSKDNRVRYVKFAADSTNKSIAEAWALMPKRVKEFAKHNNLYVREDWVNMIVGAGTKRIGDIDFVKKHTPAIVRGAIRIVEYFIRMLNSFIKTNILIKIPSVLYTNIKGNLIYHILQGHNPVEIIALTFKYVGYTFDYLRIEKEVNKLEFKKRLHKITQKEYAQLTILKKKLENSKVKPLYDLGMYQSILVDQTLEDAEYVDKFNDFLHKNTLLNKAPKPLKTMHKWLYLTKGTPYFNLMNQLTEMSDFVSRCVEYELSMKRAPKRYDNNGKVTKEYLVYRENVINRIWEAFVNYDTPQSEMLQYLNDMNIAMFTKYHYRINKVIISNIKNNPLGSLLMILSQQFIDTEDIFEQNIFNRGMNWHFIGKDILDLVTPPVIRWAAGNY